MERYMSPVKSYSYGRNRSSHRGLKIFLFILLGIVIILGILFAVNFNTIMLFFGKGHITVKAQSQIKKTVTSTGMFDNVTENTDTSGNHVLTGVSKDQAVTLTVTQQKDGTEVVDAKVDTSKLDTNGVSLSDLKNGNASAMQAAKKIADKYVGSIVDSSSETGMELYLATNLYNQYKSSPNNIDISHSFGDTDLKVTGDLSQHSLTVNLTQS